MSREYTDRFSEAESELQDKSAFVCELCNKKYAKNDAKKRDMACCGRTLIEIQQEGFGP